MRNARTCSDRLSALQDLDFAQKSSFKAFGAEAADPAQEQAMKDAIGRCCWAQVADPTSGCLERQGELANCTSTWPIPGGCRDRGAGTTCQHPGRIGRTAIELAKLANNPCRTCCYPCRWRPRMSLHAMRTSCSWATITRHSRVAHKGTPACVQQPSWTRSVPGSVLPACRQPSRRVAPGERCAGRL